MTWQKRITSVEGANALFGNETLCGEVTEGELGGFIFKSERYGHYSHKTLSGLCIKIVRELANEVFKLRAQVEQLTGDE